MRQEVQDFFLRNKFFYKIFFPFAKLKTSAHFWNQRKIPLILIPFADYFEEIFFNSYKGRWYLFYYQIHMKQSDLGIEKHWTLPRSYDLEEVL